MTRPSVRKLRHLSQLYQPQCLKRPWILLPGSSHGLSPAVKLQAPPCKGPWNTLQVVRVIVLRPLTHQVYLIQWLILSGIIIKYKKWIANIIWFLSVMDTLESICLQYGRMQTSADGNKDRWEQQAGLCNSTKCPKTNHGQGAVGFVSWNTEAAHKDTMAKSCYSEDLCFYHSKRHKLSLTASDRKERETSNHQSLSLGWQSYVS